METNLLIAVGADEPKDLSILDQRKLFRSKARFYEFEVEGHLDEGWSVWLGRLKIYHDREGKTRLSGFLPDQAALYGLIAQFRDLGLHLVSLQRVGVK